MDFEQDIYENIKLIDDQALFVFEQVFDRKIEEERPALGHAATWILSACTQAEGGPKLIDATRASLEGRQRAKLLIETGSRAKASKQMILADLAMVALCVTGAIKALESGSLTEALSLTVSASRAIGAAEADYRQLRLTQHKTGKGGHETSKANKRNTEGEEDVVIAAWRKLNPRPKSAEQAANLLTQAKIGVSHRKAAKFIAAAMRAEKADVLS